jgi:hypothetical protein
MEEVGRRRFRQCHSRCMGLAAALAPLPGAAHTRGVSQPRPFDGGWEQMSYVPCRDRHFRLKLRDAEVAARMNYAFWLKNLVERLGARLVVPLWDRAFANYDTGFTNSILRSGWVPSDSDEPEAQSPSVHLLLGDSLGFGDDAMPAADAAALIDDTPPLPQLRELHSDLSLERETSVYEALHVYMHGMALLTEVLLDELGKQGELIVYDVISTGRAGMARRKGGSFQDFVRESEEDFEKPGMYSAGLEVEREVISPREYINRVTECEWARYFRERHPGVGYLLACSTDEAGARGFNEFIRLQRTSTIMEGGSECDFRWYFVGDDVSEREGGAG